MYRHCPLFTVSCCLQTLFDQEADQVDNAVRIAPLVVIPAQHLHALANHLGQRRVNDGAALSPLKSELTSWFSS